MWLARIPAFSKDKDSPAPLVTKHIWEERYEDINAFERYLTRNGVLVRKFFLHVSNKEQKKCFLERLEDSKKNWKFFMDDVKERGFWNDYQETYEEMIQNTASKHASWYVVPADNKWFARLVISCAIVDTLNSLDLAFPDVDRDKKKSSPTCAIRFSAKKTERFIAA